MTTTTGPALPATRGEPVPGVPGGVDATGLLDPSGLADLDDDDVAAVGVVAGVLRAGAPRGRVGVAFSGGVDSSVLLALAVRALGPARVVGVLGVSPSLARDERTGAHDVARAIGVSVVEVRTHEGDDPAYRRNGPDRCYFCKDELFATIDREVLELHDLAAVAYGENADDARRPDRPGSRAATEHAVLRPLADAGMTKASVRRVARALGLPSADKPASPCLASRIPHHEEVTPAKLAQVDAAESELRRLGLGDVRVRHHGDVARLELEPADIAAVAAEPLREEVLRAVRSAGFRFVAVDLAGIQSGAFTLPLVSRPDA